MPGFFNRRENMKKVLFVFALLPAFSAANMTPEQINECVQVRINQLRESDFDDQHKEDTGMEYPISSDMIAEWEEECKNQEVETTKRVDQQKSEVDYDEAVNAMNAPYLTYGNGAYAMLKAENECWESISNATDAERCMAMTITGVYIERAWAMKKGRLPVPNYQSDTAFKRINDNMDKAKISEEEKQIARNNLKKNGNRIIPSMINVGALAQ
jgi:hypothetical protein